MRKRYYCIIIGSTVFVGVGAVLFIIATSLLRSNMVLPEQPSLTMMEKKYIYYLAKQCNCIVEREIDPRASKVENDPYKEGWYLIEFGDVPCSILSQKDSLQIVSREVVNKLHRDILGKDFGYKYKNITVVFNCRTGPNSDSSEGFAYSVEELEK